ncbi:hypothetical protein [Stenotrophomonas sp.]|uniref:hypothetical protein n=1 Tax=Stenotrophomonas sp. TaxID=69392 RepID=UPI0028A19B1E|nr:hypothetical protein [Stenotrophomonas sp.]
MNTERTEKFVNAIACDLEEGGFRQVSGTMLRRTLATAVSAALPLLPPAKLSFDVEAMLSACVPGGSIVDPQVVADNIREWAAERKPAELAEQQEGQHLSAAKGTLLALGYSWNGFQWEASSPPAEPAEQKGDSRAQFEAWMTDTAKIIVGSNDPYPAGLERDYWRVWQAALAATGKQQVGEEVEDDRFPGGFADAIAYVNELEELAEAAHVKVFGHESDGESGASTLLQMTIHQLDEKSEQVGEVQDTRAQFEVWANGRDLITNPPGAYVSCYVQNDWEVWQAALAARQPVGNAEQLDHALGQTIDQRDRYHEVADDLAAHIERITGVEIGEHSSDNCPWQNAIEAAETHSPAQGIDLGQLTRYDLDEGFDHYRGLPKDKGAHLYKDATGDWVKWDDVEALIEQRDAAPGVGS